MERDVLSRESGGGARWPPRKQQHSNGLEQCVSPGSAGKAFLPTWSRPHSWEGRGGEAGNETLTSLALSP